MKPKELAQITGRDISTVRRVLHKLRIHGLAIPIGAGAWEAEPAGLDYL